jgi:hypothetical protein
MHSRVAFVSLFALTVATVRCGGGTADPKGPGPNETPPVSRPVAMACTPTANPFSDAGAATCTTSSDCASSTTGQTHCVAGRCSIDFCLTDSDCGTGNVCECASAFYGGNAIHGNVCVPGKCRVNSDCGPEGYCVPSAGYCGSISGFYCHTPADTCVDPKIDCPSGQGQACVYDQNLGHFACATVTCNG